MPPNLTELRKKLRLLESPVRAQINQGFFKTGIGEYGHGDRFLGISVPDTRKITHHFFELSLQDIAKLLTSAWHEERLSALFILTEKYELANFAGQEKIVQFYLKHVKKVNNWDLVDSSAHQILGNHLLKTHEFVLLEKLACSSNVWERRIAIVATYAFIKQGTLIPTLHIAKMLLQDTQDLIHKATGWMLREVGKKDEKAVLLFLDKYAARMPRTMLRYAIERLSKKLRNTYLHANKNPLYFIRYTQKKGACLAKKIAKNLDHSCKKRIE